MYRTITDIRNANRNAGHHWFKPETMRWFRSRVAPGVHAGRYFISSEQYCDHAGGTCEPRRYTIRAATDAGAVETVGDFQAFATLAEARRAMRQLS